MYDADGNEAGDAAYADNVNVGEAVLIGGGPKTSRARRRPSRRGRVAVRGVAQLDHADKDLTLKQARSDYKRARELLDVFRVAVRGQVADDELVRQVAAVELKADAVDKADALDKDDGQ